jgi:transcriptional regulator with XRE-family HTH domain
MEKHSPDWPDKIKALRSAMGMSQKEFAEALGVGQPVVSAWEQGHYKPSAEKYATLGNLARFPDSMWFYERTGVDRESLLKATDELRAPAARGEVVHIHPIKRLEQGRGATEPLAFPASMIPSPAATSYLRVTDGFLRPTFNEGDILIVDESEMDLRRLEGAFIAVYRPEFRDAAGRRRFESFKASVIKEHGEKELEKAIEAGKNPFERVGLFGGWLRTVLHAPEGPAEGTRPVYVEFVIDAPSKQGALVSRVIANSHLTSQGLYSEPRPNLDLLILGRVLAWISDPKRKQRPEQKRKGRSKK